MTEQISSMSMEEEVWSLMNPQIDELTKEEGLGQLVHNENFEQIGFALERLLISQMANADGNPPPALIALTKSHIAMVEHGHETHEQRMLACRMAGRFFNQQLDEPVEYLVQLAPVWISGTEGHNGPVKDDPLRTEGAMCVVMQMKDIYSALTFEEQAEALGADNTRIWQVAVHEGLPHEVTYDGAICRPTSTRVEADSENFGSNLDDDVVYIDNRGLTEVLIGLSPGFPAVELLTNSTASQDGGE